MKQRNCWYLQRLRNAFGTTIHKMRRCACLSTQKIARLKLLQRGDCEMKKALPIILSILVIVSITGNVLFYSKLKSVNTENRNLNATISEIQASMDDLENQLSEVQADLSDTNTKNEELQSENESLQSEIESLQAELEKLQATCLEETTVNNNSDSQNGSEVASEVQEPAQSNQALQEQGDSQSNQSSNMTPEQTPSNLQPQQSHFQQTPNLQLPYSIQSL